MYRQTTTNEKLTDLIEKAGNKKLISIEINPYKSYDYNILNEIKPSFCSVLWIAKQNDPLNPKELEPIKVSKELARRGYTVLIHIPGIFYSRTQMRDILDTLKDYGVRNIFAMRGGGPWLKVEDCEFPFALAFIEFIRDEYNRYFDIVIAGFPHVHPFTQTMEMEMFYMRQKIDSGANIIMTQACLTSARYIDYKRMCIKYAIDIPIIYGVLTMRSWNDFIRIKRMSFFVDKPVMRSALNAKRQRRGRQHGRNHTKNLILEILNDDLSAGVHIFTQNNLELTKNILSEIDYKSYQAKIEKRHKIY